VVCVSDRPPAAACVRHLRHRGRRHLRRGAPVGRLWGAGRPCTRTTAPQGVVTVVQPSSVDAPIQGHGSVAAMPRAAFPLGQAVMGLPQGPSSRAWGMGRGRAPQDQVPTVWSRQRPHGLRAGANSPASGHARRRHLLSMAVVRQDGLGGHGEDLRASWAPPYWDEGRGSRAGVTLGGVTRATVGALHGLSGTGSGAIHRPHQWVVEALHVAQHPVRAKVPQAPQPHRIKGTWRQRLEPLAPLRVPGPRCNAQQRMGVLIPLVGCRRL
jgi:hypothetical protein